MLALRLGAGIHDLPSLDDFSRLDDLPNLHDLPGLEDRSVVAHLAERFFPAVRLDVHLDDATVAIAEAARHVLLHGDLRHDAEPGRQGVRGARKSIGAADIERIEAQAV